MITELIIIGIVTFLLVIFIALVTKIRLTSVHWIKRYEKNQWFYLYCLTEFIAFTILVYFYIISLHIIDFWTTINFDQQLHLTAAIIATIYVIWIFLPIHGIADLNNIHYISYQKTIIILGIDFCIFTFIIYLNLITDFLSFIIIIAIGSGLIILSNHQKIIIQTGYLFVTLGFSLIIIFTILEHLGIQLSSLIQYISTIVLSAIGITGTIAKRPTKNLADICRDNPNDPYCEYLYTIKKQ